MKNARYSVHNADTSCTNVDRVYTLQPQSPSSMLVLARADTSLYTAATLYALR